MRISFGNYYPINNQQYENLKKQTVKTGNFMYNIAEPPINTFLRYEITPEQIENDRLRNSINTFNHTQAELYSMVANPLWLPHKISQMQNNLNK